MATTLSASNGITLILIALFLACEPCPEVPPDDLEPTECATDLIGYVDGLVGAINEIETPLEERTPSDMLNCPSDTGPGEPGDVNPGYLNIFSYVGPLAKSCNRVLSPPDDCADPARSNYWVSVVDDRRAETYGLDPYGFRVIWGGHRSNYTYYGACFPDPGGFDNAVDGIPKMLRAVNDVNGDGTLGSEPDMEPGYRACGVQNHVYVLRFYVPDGSGGKTFIEKANIAKISRPFLAPSELSLPGFTGADRALTASSAYVAVNITLKSPSSEVVTAFVENNYDTTPWFLWKAVASSGAP